MLVHTIHSEEDVRSYDCSFANSAGLISFANRFDFVCESTCVPHQKLEHAGPRVILRVIHRGPKDLGAQAHGQHNLGFNRNLAKIPPTEPPKKS